MAPAFRHRGRGGKTRSYGEASLSPLAPRSLLGSIPGRCAEQHGGEVI